MNKRAQKKQKALNMKGRPTREEINTVFAPFAQQIQQTFVSLCLVTDLLIEKGIFTTEELQEFVAKKTSPPTEAPAQAQEPAVSAS